jgi:hypothetical protein
MLTGLKRAPPSSPACKPIKVNLLLSCNVQVMPVMPVMAGYTSAWLSTLAGDDLHLLRTRGWSRKPQIGRAKGCRQNEVGYGEEKRGASKNSSSLYRDRGMVDLLLPL